MTLRVLRKDPRTLIQVSSCIPLRRRQGNRQRRDGVKQPSLIRLTSSAPEGRLKAHRKEK